MEYQQGKPPLSKGSRAKSTCQQLRSTLKSGYSAISQTGRSNDLQLCQTGLLSSAPMANIQPSAVQYENFEKNATLNGDFRLQKVPWP